MKHRYPKSIVNIIQDIPKKSSLILKLLIHTWFIIFNLNYLYH